MVSPTKVSTVARANSTVPVIRAQSRPRWHERARTIQTTAAITPPATNPAISACWVEVTWLAVRSGEWRAIAVLVAPTVRTSTTMPTRLAAAPAYMTLTAFRTDAGAGGRWVSGSWVSLPG